MPDTDSPKPGVKTTEFWTHAINMGVGLGMVALGLLSNADPSTRQVLVGSGLGLMGISQGTYSVGRAIVKRGKQ